MLGDAERWSTHSMTREAEIVLHTELCHRRGDGPEVNQYVLDLNFRIGGDFLLIPAELAEELEEEG
jgi:hypothetical protein